MAPQSSSDFFFFFFEFKRGVGSPDIYVAQNCVYEWFTKDNCGENAVIDCPKNVQKFSRASRACSDLVVCFMHLYYNEIRATF